MLKVFFNNQINIQYLFETIQNREYVTVDRDRYGRTNFNLLELTQI
jgi:hypothetical protein